MKKVWWQNGAVGCRHRWRRVWWGSLGQGSPSTTRAHIRLVQGQGRPQLAHCVHGSDSMPFDGPPASAYDRQPQHRRLSCDAISPSTSRLRFGQARDHLPAGGPHTDLDPVPVPQTRAIPITHLHRLASRNHTTDRRTLTFRPSPPPPPVLLLTLLSPPPSGMQRVFSSRLRREDPSSSCE